MSSKLASHAASIPAEGTMLLTKPRLIATLILPVLFWAVPSPATAFEGDTLKLGGSGGSEFHASCGPGGVLAGFSYTTGKDLDNIQMKCRSMNGARADGPETDMGGIFGRDNPNGRFNAAGMLTCPAPMVVQAMSVTESAVLLVHSVRFTCRNLETGERADTGWSSTYEGKGGKPGYADCGDNGYAVGLWGASGALIDALGLTCAEYHRPQPPPPPPGPPQKPIKHMAHGGGSASPPADPCIEARTAKQKGMSPMLVATFEKQCRLRGGDPNAPDATLPARSPPMQQAENSCSVGTATVAINQAGLEKLNVRNAPGGRVTGTLLEGETVSVTGPCGGSSGAAGLAANKQSDGDDWCRISAPVSGCVSARFLVFGGGDVDQPDDVAGLAKPNGHRASASAAASFGGSWSADADNVAYSISLNQQGSSVSGHYDGADGSAGQISGHVSGNVLRFTWTQTDGTRGSGKFVLSADGESFDGTYSSSSNPDAIEGSWNGRRQ